MTGVTLGRRFWTLFTAFSASNLGDGLTLVGFPLLAVSLTSDARLVTLVAASRFLPFLLIGLPAGVIIDRFDRRILAMIAQSIRVTTQVTIGALVLTEATTIAALALGAFVTGMGEVMIDGGVPAIVRDVVTTTKLELANSRLRASESVTNWFVGPPVGALMFGVNPALPFLFGGGLYVASIALLSFLPGSFVPEPDPDDGTFVEKMQRGLRYVWGHPVLRPLALAVAAFGFCGEAVNAVFVLLATERLGLSSFQYGLLLTVDAVGSIIMSFFVTRLVTRTSHGTSMRLSVTAWTLFAFIAGATTFIPLIVLAAALSGVADPTWNVISATVRQRLVDDHIFGRMMTAYLFIAWSTQPIGALVGGIIAEAFGTQWVYVMAGCIVGSLLLWAQPLFRRINASMASLE